MNCQYCQYHKDTHQCAYYQTVWTQRFKELDFPVPDRYLGYDSCEELNSEGNCPFGVSVNFLKRMKIFILKLTSKVKVISTKDSIS